MTNTELTLDQLQAVSGGATAIEYGLMAEVSPKDNTGESLGGISQGNVWTPISLPW